MTEFRRGLTQHLAGDAFRFRQEENSRGDRSDRPGSTKPIARPKSRAFGSIGRLREQSVHRKYANTAPMSHPLDLSTEV
jgi:hypothetical protein